MAPDLRKLKDRANEAVEKGKHKKAAELFLELAQAEPAEPGWSHRAGELLRKVGRNGEAIDCLIEAATGYARQGFLLKGVAVLKVVLSVDGAHAEAQRLLAVLVARLASPQDVGAAAAPAGPERAAQRPASGAPPPRPAPAVSPPMPAPPSPGSPAARRGVAPPAPPEAGPRRAPAAIELRPEEPLASLPLGRLMPGAHPSREMPAIAVVEIPLDADGIEIGAFAPPEGVVPPAFPDQRPASDPGVFELDPEASELELSLEPTGYAVPLPPVAAPPAAAPPAAASPPPRPAAPPPPVELTAAEEFAASPSSLEAALGAAEPLVELRGLAPPEPPFPALPPIPLFSSLSPDELRLLVQRVTVLEVAAGELIFAEGDPGDALFVVVRGAVQVFRGAGRDRVDLERLGEGAFFGEVSLLSQAPRSASVVADGDGTLIRVSRAVIGEILSRFPAVLGVLLEFFRGRLVTLLTASSPLFAPFSPAERQELVRQFRLIEIDAGSSVIREGELTPGLFILLAGRMDVSVAGADGEVQLAFLGAADLFGEMSLLTRGPAMATIRAATKCWALFMPRTRFHEILLTHPQVLAFISDIVEQRRLENDATLAGRRPYGEGRLPAY